MRRLLLYAALAGLLGLFVHEQRQGTRMEPPRVAGESAPTISLPDLQGTRVSLASLRGRPVLVNFWATWCPPCRAELPALEQLARDKPSCLAVLGVTLDSGGAREVGAFAKENQLDYPLLLDDGSAGRAYKVITLPHSVLVAPDGTIAGRFRGPVTGVGVRAALQGLHLPEAPRC